MKSKKRTLSTTSDQCMREWAITNWLWRITTKVWKYNKESKAKAASTQRQLSTTSVWCIRIWAITNWPQDSTITL